MFLLTRPPFVTLALGDHSSCIQFLHELELAASPNIKVSPKLSFLYLNYFE